MFSKVINCNNRVTGKTVFCGYVTLTISVRLTIKADVCGIVTPMRGTSTWALLDATESKVTHRTRLAGDIYEQFTRLVMFLTFFRQTYLFTRTKYCFQWCHWYNPHYHETSVPMHDFFASQMYKLYLKIVMAIKLFSIAYIWWTMCLYVISIND